MVALNKDMNKAIIALVLVFVLVLSTLLASSVSSQTFSPRLERKIVVFKDGVDEQMKESLIRKHKATKIKDLKIVSGKAVLLRSQDVAEFASEEAVLRIDDDVEVFALARSSGVRKTPKPQPSQVLPWGLDRIDAEKAWAATTAENIKVAIIDTGIDLDHPDLKYNIKGGYNAIYPRKAPNDNNGHGTHVAGIVAALNNSFGVVGVAPKVSLYAVKVLSDSGSGYLSDIIEGLDWAIQNGMQVVNMSLGTSSDVQSFRDAIEKVNRAGIVQVAAAGNSGGSVTYPAAYPEVIAVSAIDQEDKIASFSSRGPEVDLAAPGVSIYSTYKGSSYRTLSGTSMASPHVAGSAALVLSVPEKCDLNGDDICSPLEVKQRLEQTAEDLGEFGQDSLYGAGLVSAYRVVGW